MKRKLIAFVKKHSYFDYEEGNSDDNQLAFATRENGDMTREEYSEKDWKEGMKIAKLLEEAFRDKINIELEVVDEWVLLDIEIL